MSYDYERRTAGQQRYFQSLVDIVDDIDQIASTLQKTAPAIVAKLEKLATLLGQDRALRPHHDKLMLLLRPMLNTLHALKAVEKAGDDLQDRYGDLNEAIDRIAPHDELQFAM